MWWVGDGGLEGGGRLGGLDGWVECGVCVVHETVCGMCMCMYVHVCVCMWSYVYTPTYPITPPITYPHPITHTHRIPSPHTQQREGTILFNNLEPGKNFDLLSSTVYLDSNDAHIPELTVRETLNLAAQAQGIGEKESM